MSFSMTSQARLSAEPYALSAVRETRACSWFRWLCQGWRRAGSAEAELLFLFGPGQRKVSCELRDGHVSRRAALRDGLNDARRQIGEGRQESDMALGQLFVFADRAKVERGVFEDRLDPVPRPRDSGQQ